MDTKNGTTETTPKTNTDTKNQKIGCLAVIIIIGVIAAAIYYSNPDIGAHVVARQSIIEHYPMDSKVYVENTCNWRWTKEKITKSKKESNDGLLFLMLAGLEKQLQDSPEDVFMLVEKIQVTDPFGNATVDGYACVGVQGEKVIFFWPCSERGYNNCDVAFNCCTDGFRIDIGR